MLSLGFFDLLWLFASMCLLPKLHRCWHVGLQVEHYLNFNVTEKTSAEITPPETRHRTGSKVTNSDISRVFRTIGTDIGTKKWTFFHIVKKNSTSLLF